MYRYQPMLLALSLLLVAVGFAPAWGETIEIYPGQSFESHAEALRPGDTLIVHEGTYSESGRLSITVEGTSTLPVVIKGADGEARPLITRPAGSAAQNTINIEGASHVTISHLEISGNGDGINMNSQPHHITIEDNEIHHIDVGVNFRSSMDHIVVRRNHIHHTSGTGEGMYVGCHDGDCQVSRSLIENNWVHDTGGSQGDGIEIKVGSWGNIIRDNVIHDTQEPCILEYGVPDDRTDHPNIIEGNVIWNCSEGIDVMADAVVRNNIAIGALKTQNHAMTPVPRNVTIVNNTVIGDLRLDGWSGNAGSLTVANNVVFDGRIINLPATAVAAANLVYETGPAGIFVNAGADDYWPADGSPLLGAADGAHAPTTDFNGTPRTAPFDVGAYETEGLTANPGWAIEAGFKGLVGGRDQLAPSPPQDLMVE